jgi:nucleoid DNA-binding protein
MGLSTKVGHRLAIKKNPGSAAYKCRLSLREFGMLRSDLVWRISHQNPHLLFRDAEKIVDALFDEITAALARGKRIELRGFGTFSVKIHEAELAVIPGRARWSQFQKGRTPISRWERK